MNVYGLWFARVWGTSRTSPRSSPSCSSSGGIGQLGAALWGYRAGNAVAAALHGSRGAFSGSASG